MYYTAMHCLRTFLQSWQLDNYITNERCGMISVMPHFAVLPEPKGLRGLDLNVLKIWRMSQEKI